MYRGHGRGGAANFLQSRPISELPPVFGVLREDAVEIGDDEDMKALYRHGFYGKGTVSRRQANRALVVPPESLDAWASAMEKTPQRVIGGKRSYTQDSSLPSVSRKRTRTADGAAGVVHASEEGSEATTGLQPPADDALDPLSRLAQDFEEHVASAALPDAYSAAATAVSHGHDVLDFETCRLITHYVSCPPPRLRHVQAAIKGAAQGQTEGKGVSGDEEPTMRPAGPSGTGVGPALRFEHIAFETSILEPEAAVYLAERATPGRFVVTEGHYGAAVGSVAAPPLTSVDLWRRFCSSVHNFPARYAVYAVCRDAGWVVRDGHGFGADFVLYDRGPGSGHAPICIVVMPMRVVYSNGGAPVSGQGSGQGEHVQVRRPVSPAVSGSWLSTHAHARVINSVKKALVHAHCSLCVHGPAPTEAEGGGSYYPQAVAAFLTCPNAVHPQPRGPGTMRVELLQLSRWGMALEHKRKNEAAASALAFAAIEDGLDLDFAPVDSGTAGAVAGETHGRPLSKQERQLKMRQAFAKQIAARGAASSDVSRPSLPSDGASRPIGAQSDVVEGAGCEEGGDPRPHSPLGAAGGGGSLGTDTEAQRREHTALLAAALAGLHAPALPGASEVIRNPSCGKAGAGWYVDRSRWIEEWKTRRLKDKTRGAV